MKIEVTAEELRFIIRCGVALAQNVPNTSLLTYCGFNKDQIAEFSGRMRDELEKEGLDMELLERGQAVPASRKACISRRGGTAIARTEAFAPFLIF